MKRCTKFGEEKELLCFYKDKNCPDGYQYHCKSCVCRRGRERRDANPEINKQRCKNYREANKEKLRITANKWRSNNLEKVKAYKIKNYQLHKHEYKIKNKLFVLNNPDKVRAYKHKWRTNNKEIIKNKSKLYWIISKERQLERQRNWRLNNPEKYKESRVRAISTLSNAYVRSSLQVPKGTQVPKELIELQRIKLKLHRQLKEMK